MPTSSDQGGIIRVAHNRANPYTMVNRAGAEDPALSWEARGVLFYLLCKPDGWQVRFGDLLRKGNARRFMLRRILKELETAGYLVREQTRAADGRWEWLSTVYEAPGVNGRPLDNRAVADPPRAEPPPYIESALPNNESTENPAPALPTSEELPPLAPHVLRAQAAYAARLKR